MHIKKIVISGFKSYGEHTAVDSLNPGSNVIVGINGCGKSNFFAAIQFVLSDKFSHLQKDERQALLHEGTGPRSMTATVEIIFDNSDRRINVDKNEVSLKRVIGAKKDQYILNKSIVTRSEVVSLLETAGFSKSNPYYIIPQGKINEVAMTPETRLMLLKEIAGVQVYEDKRKESLSILNDTQVKIKNIEELLQTINEKLDTLRNETEELEAFQLWDRKMRTIEHIIYDRELSNNKEKIIQLKTSHADLKRKQARLQNIIEDFSNQMKEINHNMKRMQRDTKMVEEENDNLKKELDKLEAEKESQLIKIDDVQLDITLGTENQKLINEELEALNIQIKKTQTKLEEIEPEYEIAVKSGEKIIRELDSLDQELQLLYARRGRDAQFHTKEERNAWIHKELSSIDNQIEEKQKHIQNLEERIDKNNRKLSDLKKSQKLTIDNSENQYKAIDNYRKEYNDFNIKKDESSANKKDLWKEEKALLNELAYLEEDLAKLNQDLNSRFGKEIFNGINSVKRVLQTFSKRADMMNQLYKYHDVVINCFTCQPGLYLPVEVTAGSRLFYHVVDDAKFGQEILREMNRQGLPGVVNFMPLDRLKAEARNYPNFDNALPLISKLEFDPTFLIPMRYIFGKMILCRNLKVATEIAANGRFDCVTTEGDEAAAKGWLKGGHYVNSKSPMKMHQDKTELVKKMDSIRKKLSNLNEQIKEADSEITQFVSGAQCAETKQNNARETYDKLQYDLENIKKQLRILENNRILESKKLEELKLDLNNMQTLRQKLVEELEQDLNAQLTEADESQIVTLNESMKKLKKKLKDEFNKRKKLEQEKMDYDNKLSKNLICKQKELERKLQEIGLEDNKVMLQELEYQSRAIAEKIKKCKKDLKLSEIKYKDAVIQMQKKHGKLDELETLLKPAQNDFEKNSEKIDRVSNNIRILEGNIEDTTRTIIELGPLPSNNQYTKYQEKDTKTLYKKLENCRKNLKNYEHINKKALDQYEIFKDQRDNLFKRKEELDRASEKIQQLFDFLQQKKYEAVEFTFKQVSKYFTDIFSKIVPRGKGQLVMQQSNSQSENDSMSTNSLDLVNLVGIGIRVSFTGQTSAMIDYNHLSGGQKSLVALTLIFAIQKCDPAPFYLFDEIDGDLDVDHRRAVAQMIHELSSDAQFIIITHRPELLEQVNQFYGVRFQNNKVSSIFNVSREEALEFIQADGE